MTATTFALGALLISFIAPFAIDMDADLDGDRAVISAVVTERSPGSSSSSSTGRSSSGSGAGPLVVCTRIDTVTLGSAVLSQCVRTDGIATGVPLTSILEPVIDVDGNPIDPAATPPIVVTASDLQSLPILSGEVRVQPPGGRALINVEVIGYSTATSHILNATVMGTNVRVRVTPVRWGWQFTGDDTGPFTTDHPGGPYPNKTVHGMYSTTGQGREVISTITWMGEYQVADGPWILINGNAITTARSAPFETTDAPVRLVNDTLNK